MGPRPDPFQRVPVILEIDEDIARHPENFSFDHFHSHDFPVRQWAGCTVLIFPALENDGVPLPVHPLVRQFYRLLFAEVPFYLYFMEPDPVFEEVACLAFAEARDDQIVQGDELRIEFDDELNAKMARHLATAAAYAAAVGDNWREMVNEYPFPEAGRAMAVQLVEKWERSRG